MAGDAGVTLDQIGQVVQNSSGTFDAAQVTLSNWLRDAVASWTICQHLEISDDRRQFLLKAVVEECHKKDVSHRHVAPEDGG